MVTLSIFFHIFTGGAITKQSISRYEKGVMHPKQDAMMALTSALNISEAYFEGTNMSIDMPMLRSTSNSKLSDDELQALEAQLSFWAEQYLAKEQEAGITSHFENPIQGTSVTTMEDAIQAADLLRERWHCDGDPIASVIRLLERKGIKRDFLTLEEMIDLKELYGIPIAAQVHEARGLRMITREHYEWWYDECINKNRIENQ